jgi:ABC-type histidine transport system ATPase subunit
MGFAREVSSRVVFLHEGDIEEEGETQEIFSNPSSERFRQFVSK